MDIIYRLVNLDKSEGMRFYIGSKQECKVVDIDGLSTIITVSSGKRYIGSSSNIQFKKDLEEGNRFNAEVLQVSKASERKFLYELENEWIKKYDAVNSQDYYNLGHALNKSRCSDNVVNLFGQKMKELAKDNSNMGKRDAGSKELGFSNFGEMAFFIYEEYLKTGVWKDVSDKLGKHRHYASTSVKYFDMEKAKLDLSRTDLLPELRKLVGFENCSLRKACEILKIELPAGRVMLCDYKYDKRYGVAFNMGYTEDELEIKVTRMIIEGKGFQEVSRELGIVLESVKRLFFRKIRTILRPEDVK